MTTYDNLPLYKTSYDLLLQIFEIVKKFEKQYKYTLWDKIKNEIIDLITSIYRANSSFDKRLKNIKKAREQVEVLKLYLRLCKDLKILPIKIFAEVCMNTESIWKQLFSWEKSLCKK